MAGPLPHMWLRRAGHIDRALFWRHQRVTAAAQALRSGCRWHTQVRRLSVRRTVENVPANGARLELLGSFAVRIADHTLVLPLGAQRLFVLLALQPDGVHRGVAAEHLWPDCPPCRAAANLRSALYQVRRVPQPSVIEGACHQLQLSSQIQVDLRIAEAKAREIAAGTGPLPSADEDAVGDLTRELLPGWPDDWLVLERECWDQLRIRALESLARRFQTARQYLPALQIALSVLSVEPLRETPHRIMIEVHLAEGNVASAFQCYRKYRALLHKELGIAPSPKMVQLLRDMKTG
ncbi:BTAD domain-containing putative transcriptional regulator [Streptomyces sp. NPDC058954]|uniref:AfsR/SARP family transcriptional regulator n=1 Tax=Streptomyces sp. NPDC058954 TaxID=3346677 RepID=UPI0036D1AB94